MSVLAGKVAAPELATMDARRVRDLTEPPAPSATPHPGLQQDANGALAGTTHAHDYCLTNPAWNGMIMG